MRNLTYHNKNYDCLASETVLDTLLRHDIDISYSCKNGTCQSCLLKTSSTEIPTKSQVGLNKTLIQHHFFLPCVCEPIHDFTIIDSKPNEIFIDTQVIDKNWLSEHVCQIILKKPKHFQFQPGQFINIRNKNRVTRSYSIASTTVENKIELHIKHLQNGQMSTWLCHELNPGNTVQIQGANGANYYEVNTLTQNILLIGTGTGLAPLLGIVKAALENKHEGTIHLYHGSRYCDGLYLIDEIRQLTKTHSNLQYYPCISSLNPLLNNRKNIPNCIQQRADDAALEHHSSLKNWKVYLCGNPDMVKKVKTKVYLIGAALADIHLDPFELKDLRSNSR